MMRTKKTANFGEWVRRNLTTHGKTITWLADQLGSNPTMILKWRTGTEPRAVNYIMTCQALAKLRGDPVAIVLCEGAAHLGVPVEYSGNNWQHPEN